MLRFSSTGLNELHHLTQQVKSFILEEDYILLSSITNSIRADGSIDEVDYTHLVSLVESYTKEGNLGIPPHTIVDPSDGGAIHVLTQENEEIAYISLLNLRLFLLSYSGIDNPSLQAEQTPGLSLEY